MCKAKTASRRVKPGDPNGKSMVESSKVGISKKESKKEDVKKENEEGKGDMKKEEMKKEVSEPKQPIKQTNEQVSRWIQRALDMGVPSLRDEYKALSKWCPDGMTSEAFKQNHPDNKNRYQDVPCQDARRVVLTWPGVTTDYIHANYVKTPQAENRFICAQGPLEGTVHEFWAMVLQEEVETIVMLCNLIELGKIKCHKYFPMEKGETMTVADINITNMEKRSMCPEEVSVQLSILSVKFTKDGKEETREIRHYHWIDWPDRGVPPCRLTSLELLSRIRGTTKPIVVHCSAGIGRTGSIVAIEYTLERLQHGMECVDMDKLLKELREQRPWSIQNDLQYLYIHRILLHYFLDKYKEQNAAILTPENVEKYKKFIEEYDKAVN